MDRTSWTKAHLRDAVRWNSSEQIEIATVPAAGLGMAIPVLVGLAVGHLGLGLAAGMGALAAGSIPIEPGIRNFIGSQLRAFGPTIVAVAVSVILDGHGWLGRIGVVSLVAAAALIRGLHRQIAMLATKFILFLLIASAMPLPAGPDSAKIAIGLLVLVICGATWTASLEGMFRVFLRPRPSSEVALVRAAPTWSQSVRRWLRSLRTIAGWSYTIRIALSVAVSEALEAIWPTHHLHWIGLTAAIIMPRQAELMPVKTTQRALGTFIGVILASLLLSPSMPSWMIVCAFGILAGVRPLLRTSSYLAYSVVMTPLMVLITSAGQENERGVLLDRLVATLLGAMLVTATGLLIRNFEKRAPEQAKPESIWSRPP